MFWYNYVACFFSGAFLTNAIPHFFHGISGDKFPTPFAKPHGKGLSSPLLNVFWGMFNFIMSSLLFYCSSFSMTDLWCAILLFSGMTAMGIRLSFVFSKKDKE
jgi:hypothetical protein